MVGSREKVSKIKAFRSVQNDVLRLVFATIFFHKRAIY